MRDGGSSLFNKTNIPINQNLKRTVEDACPYDVGANMMRQIGIYLCLPLRGRGTVLCTVDEENEVCSNNRLSC